MTWRRISELTGMAGIVSIAAVASARAPPSPTAPPPDSSATLPPAEPTSSAPAPAPTGPVQPAPVQPAPVQPAPVQPGPMQPGPYAPAQPAPGGYGYPPPPRPAPPPEPEGPHAGPYFGGFVGVGGPYGADTATGTADFKQGFGALGTAGYAFVPNFGIGAFLHYNTSKLEYRSTSSSSNLDENSGHVLLYGLEARGIVGSGFMLGYASFGVAFGTGSLTLSDSASSGGVSASVKEDDSIDFKPMPVLGFGVEAEVVPGLSLGPIFRWYIVSANKACSDQSQTFGGATSTNSDCTQDFANFSIPDIVFVGAGATFRL
jgi:hypothetical protein